MIDWDQQAISFEQQVFNHKSAADFPLTKPLLWALELRIRHWTYRAPAKANTLATAIEELAGRQANPLLQAQAAFLAGLAAQGSCNLPRVREKIGAALPIFVAHGMHGWQAACSWLGAAQPWLLNDFAAAVRTLEKALPVLQSAPGLPYAADCQLSLAFACLLINRLEKARTHFTASLTVLEKRSPEEYVNGLLQYVLISQREGDRVQNQQILDQIETLLAGSPAAVLRGKLLYRRGFAAQGLDGDLEQAERYFEQALTLFEKTKLPLWAAQTRQILAFITAETYRLKEARAGLEAAGAVFQAAGLKGLLANNWHDRSFIYVRQKRFSQGIEASREAIKLHHELQLPVQAALVQVNLGLCHAGLGDYQQGIALIERSFDVLANYREPVNQRATLLSLALIWLDLGRAREARQTLDRMADFELVTTTRTEVERLILEARAAELEGDLTAVIAHLEEAASRLNHSSNTLPYLQSKIDFLLAQTHYAQREFEGALRAANRAFTRLTDLSILLEAAQCALLTANIYLDQGQWDQVIAWCATARSLNEDRVDDLTWEVEALLGQVALAINDMAAGRQNLDAALQSLRLVGGFFWQPELTETYFRRRRGSLEALMAIATADSSPVALLELMHAARARSTIEHLLRQHASQAYSDPEMASTLAEMDQIQTEMQQTGNRVAIFRLNRQRRQRVQQLNEQLSRHERRTSVTSPGETAFPAAVSPKGLRFTYHLGDETLWIHAVTPAGTQIVQRQLGESHHQALTRMAAATNPHHARFQDDCRILGELLFPREIAGQLARDEYLLIAPHDRLFALPWGALEVNGQKLVERAIPAVVPSWADLETILQRSPHPPRRRGKLVAVSDFGDRHLHLPHIMDEVAALRRRFEPMLDVALEEKWVQFAGRELGAYDFLHLATHTFHDDKSGFLSGIAFADEDIWHHALLPLAPLPPLITLTTCSSLKGYVTGGDAIRSLAATCLAAGSRTVVGSLWAIPDGSATSLMVRFYRRWLGGEAPARALVRAQREVLQENPLLPLSFICFGSPF